MGAGHLSGYKAHISNIILAEWGLVRRASANKRPTSLDHLLILHLFLPLDDVENNLTLDIV